MKTIADSYREEGINKGILIGEARGKITEKTEIAKNLLMQNINVKTISNVTGLSLWAIEKLKN